MIVHVRATEPVGVSTSNMVGVMSSECARCARSNNPPQVLSRHQIVCSKLTFPFPLSLLFSLFFSVPTALWSSESVASPRLHWNPQKTDWRRAKLMAHSRCSRCSHRCLGSAASLLHLARHHQTAKTRNARTAWDSCDKQRTSSPTLYV